MPTNLHIGKNLVDSDAFLHSKWKESWLSMLKVLMTYFVISLQNYCKNWLSNWHPDNTEMQGKTPKYSKGSVISWPLMQVTNKGRHVIKTFFPVQRRYRL
jgi:hypothetical protein